MAELLLLLVYMKDKLGLSYFKPRDGTREKRKKFEAG